MKKILILIIALAFNYTYAQQNLVPNGSFEDTVNCPSYANGFYINTAKYWFNPNTGTADYFNSCSTYFDTFQNRFFFSVPQNYIGFQYAHTGNAYGGYVFTQNAPDSMNPNLPYAEYMQVKLLTPLQKNKIYEVKYYVSPSTNGYYSNSTGCYLSNTAISRIDFDVFPFTPQIQSNPNIFISDTLNWIEVKGTYNAAGGEEYITIGNFKTYPTIKNIDDNGNQIPFSNFYHYVDDVSIIEVNENNIINELITPNGDGLNDYLKINANDLLLVDFQIQIFNRWGSEVFNSKDLNFVWDGKYKNEKLPSSTYFILITGYTNAHENFIYKNYVQLLY